MINPLSPRATVLAVLYSGPANGPELRARAVKLSKGLVNPGQGSMYTTLFKLMSLKLVEKTAGGGQKKVAKGGKRMSGQFRLTGKGAAEAKKVRAAVEAFFTASAPKGAKSEGRARPTSKKKKAPRAAKAKTNGHAKANGTSKAVKAKAKSKSRKKTAVVKTTNSVKPAVGGVPAMLAGVSD